MIKEFNFEFPTIYREFLSQIDKEGEFLIENTGVVLYSKIDLEERNATYQIEEWEPDFFLIGQEGDRAFFIKKDYNDTIYMNDLGALGSLEMRRISSNIYEFVKYVAEHYDEI